MWCWVVDYLYVPDGSSAMKQADLRELVCGIVREFTAHPGGETRYRSPIIGFCSADHEKFTRLQENVPEHLTPWELLPGARGLVSYFLPFSEDIVGANARSSLVAREWAVAYVETNRVLSEIGKSLIKVLAEQGIRAVSEAPTYEFDKAQLKARWSHKSIACMTGTGSFGLNSLVITDAGCAGRFGSLIIDVDPGVAASPDSERCLYHHNGTCGLCVQRCPVGALKMDGPFDRKLCYEHLVQADAYFADLPLTDVCGKCAVGLPCSLTNPVGR